MPRKYFFNIEKIKIESHEKYYWLGFIAGDGSVQEQGRRLRIELKNDSLDILEQIKEILNINNSICERNSNYIIAKEGKEVKSILDKIYEHSTEKYKIKTKI